MQDLSIGEVETLVLKAYRGAGFSWGLAQEAGQAAGAMAMRRLPALQQFSELLPLIDATPYPVLAPVDTSAACWRGSSGQLCPVIAGVALADSDPFTGSAALRIENLLQPLILLPFVCQLSTVVELTVGGDTYLCGDQQWLRLDPVGSSVDRSPGRADVQIVASQREIAGVAPVLQRAVVDSDTVERLGTYAHRTYVPATEASRLAGAGAGLLDND